MKSRGYALQFADKSFRKDKEIVLEAVISDAYCALKYADKSFRKDKEIVLEAVKRNGVALEHADESLKNDPDILAIVSKKK